jgi:hypothetical protein
MLISRLAIEHKKELERINTDFAERVDKFTSIEDTLSKTIIELKKDLKEYSVKLIHSEDERKLLIKIVDESIKSKEKEVQLRIKFEEKINNMHAVNRVTEEIYERSKEDIDAYKTKKESLEVKCNAQLIELKELRALKEDNVAVIKYGKETIKSLMHEKDMSKRNIKDLDDRIVIILEKSNEYLSRNFGLENDMERLKLNVDKEISEKEGYIKERDYFKIQNDKITEDNKTLEDRIDKLRIKYDSFNEKIIEKDQKIIDLSAMEAINQERFFEFIKKIEDLKTTIDVLDKDNQTFSENNKTYNQLNDVLKKDQEEIAIEMKKINNERNHFNHLLKDANRKITSLNGQIQHSEEILARTIKQHEKAKGKLVESERYSDVLEIKKSAFERTVEIQKIQMLEQIKTVSEQASSEKEARQKWIERYEKEYKSHLDTTSEVMSLRTGIKELQHKFDNKETELKINRLDYNKVSKGYEDKREENIEIFKELGNFI